MLRHKSAIETPAIWTTETVSRILNNREYIGDTVLGRTCRKSYKDKRKVDLPPEKHLIFENTHEAVISKEVWETVQRLRGNKRRNCSTGEKDKFAGLVVCADCGKIMYNIRAKTLTHMQEAFVCGNYRRKVQSCTAHFIRTVILEELVMASLRQVLIFANEQESVFRDYVIQRGQETQRRALQEQRRELEKAEHRMAELDILFQKLFEGNATGRISDERFITLSVAYEEEQRELRQKRTKLSAEVSQADEEAGNMNRFLGIAKKYADLQELTPTILRELISHILVHEPEKVNGKKRIQKIQLFYNFIGSIDLPQKQLAESL